VNGASSAFTLRVTDIKQWFYCPRVVYFTYVMPVDRRITPKMGFGVEQHQVISALERRRTLRRYGLADARRLFHVRLRSRQLGLTGLLDLLIVASAGGAADRYYPVEFKDTLRNISANHRCQLAGYGLLVEEEYSCRVDRGFVYQVPTERVTGVRLDDGLKSRVREAVLAMREMIASERMPAAAKHRGKCVDCEFVNYCGDRF